MHLLIVHLLFCNFLLTSRIPHIHILLRHSASCPFIIAIGIIAFNDTVSNFSASSTIVIANQIVVVANFLRNRLITATATQQR